MAITPPAPMPRPGVQVIQQIATPSPAAVEPTLYPCVIGTAYEVTNVLNSDGSLNAGDVYGTYEQMALAITESSFPAPRGNIDELSVLSASIAPYLLAGGHLGELMMNPGSSFLYGANLSRSPSIASAIFNGATGLALAGKTLVLAIDQPVDANTQKDIAVTFTGGGNLTSAQAAAQINAAVGQAVATVVGAAPNDTVQIASLNYGAEASVTIRIGGSANSVLALGYVSGASAEERVEGAGFRGQDISNGTTQTPWIEFYVGAYLVNGTSTTVPTKVNWFNILAPTTAINAVASSVGFGTGGGQIPIQVGDQFFTDGQTVGSTYIMKVEAARFKIGTINTTLSVADSSGQYTSVVYNPYTVGTILDASPFTPKFAYFVANNINWATATPVAASIVGGLAGTAATQAVVTGTGALAGPFDLAGLTLNWTLSTGGVNTSGTFTFTGGPFTNMAAVEAAIGSNIPGVTVGDDGGVPPQLKFTTTAYGDETTFTILDTGSANSALGFSTSSSTSATGTDVVFASLTGTTLKFSFDGNPHQYVATFTSNSILDAVAEINAVVGATVASTNAAGTKLVLTSPLAGLASSVVVPAQTPTAAETIFAIVTTPTLSTGAVYTAGSGRPFPNAYLDDAEVLHIGAEILRDPVTGLPLDQQFNDGTLYIQYQALRLDVSPLATVAGVLRISDPNVLSTVLNPITDQNPLGLGMFLAMLNAPTYVVKGLGIDSTTAEAPYGTSVAWARAAAMLEAEEVYALAPLTQDPTIFGLMQTHADVMSSPEEGGERIVFINPVIPTRANPVVALSGSNSNSTPTPNQMLLDGNPSPGLLAAGINPALPIPETAGVYMTFTVNGVEVNYNVSGVNSSIITLRTAFSSPSTNADGFYTTTTLNVSVIDAPYSLNVRGAPLVIAGSNPALPDYTAISDTIAEANQGYKDRRVYSVFPDTVQVSVGGITKNLPGFYGCAAIAGMVAAQPPQQGFTNFPITGLVGVVGTSKFTKDQLDQIAGGGTYILIQDALNGPVSSRHQLSTDLSSIETRELSITKVVDFVAKFLRAAVRRFIGVNVINPGLLDALGTMIHAVLQFLETSGVLNGSNLNQIIQDSAEPDTVLGDITLDVPYPCNYIRLTLAF